MSGDTARKRAWPLCAWSAQHIGQQYAVRSSQQQERYARKWRTLPTEQLRKTATKTLALLRRKALRSRLKCSENVFRILQVRHGALPAPLTSTRSLESSISPHRWEVLAGLSLRAPLRTKSLQLTAGYMCCTSLTLCQHVARQSRAAVDRASSQRHLLEPVGSNRMSPVLRAHCEASRRAFSVRVSVDMVQTADMRSAPCENQTPAMEDTQVGTWPSLYRLETTAGQQVHQSHTAASLNVRRCLSRRSCICDVMLLSRLSGGCVVAGDGFVASYSRPLRGAPWSSSVVVFMLFALASNEALAGRVPERAKSSASQMSSPSQTEET